MSTFYLDTFLTKNAIDFLITEKDTLSLSIISLSNIFIKDKLKPNDIITLTKNFPKLWICDIHYTVKEIINNTHDDNHIDLINYFREIKTKNDVLLNNNIRILQNLRFSSFFVDVFLNENNIITGFKLSDGKIIGKASYTTYNITHHYEPDLACSDDKHLSQETLTNITKILCKNSFKNFEVCVVDDIILRIDDTHNIRDYINTIDDNVFQKIEITNVSIPDF